MDVGSASGFEASDMFISNNKIADLERAKRAAKAQATAAKVDEAAQEFESVFMSQMLQHMFADVDMSPMADGPGKEIYQSMLVDEYGKIITRAGGIGIADHVKREMLRLQEVE